MWAKNRVSATRFRRRLCCEASSTQLYKQLKRESLLLKDVAMQSERMLPLEHR
jgi:hypothetical protein